MTMAELVAGLMLWVSAHTGLPLPEAPPAIAYADGCIMHQLYRGPEKPCPAPGTRAPRIRGLYIWSQTGGLLVLREEWDPTAARDVAYLVHELVHHAQHHAVTYDPADLCARAEREREAYDAQAAWLRELGVDDPLAVMGISTALLSAITTPGQACADAVR